MQNAYIPGTITTYSWTPHSYITEALGKQHWRTRQHIWPLHRHTHTCCYKTIPRRHSMNNNLQRHPATYWPLSVLVPLNGPVLLNISGLLMFVTAVSCHSCQIACSCISYPPNKPSRPPSRPFTPSRMHHSPATAPFSQADATINQFLTHLATTNDLTPTYYPPLWHQ